MSTSHSEESEYPLSQWKDSVLLKEACEHLRDSPPYIHMSPEAHVEMTRFCYAVRRALEAAKAARGYGPYAINHMSMEYNLDLSTTDHNRYTYTVHGYTFTMITGI